MRQKLRILVIDDSEGDCLLIKRALKKCLDSRKALFEVSVCYDGEAGLKHLLDGDQLRYPPPHLIFLDLRMPVMDGFDVLKALKASEKTRHVPVVVLTTSADPADVQEAMALGANAYLTKPVRPNEFNDLIAITDRFWFQSHILPDD